MAIFNFHMDTSTKSGLAKYNYNSRNGKYSYKEDFLYSASYNLPKFCEGKAEKFWEAGDYYEGVDRTKYRKIEFSLPTELSDEENIELAEKYAKELLGKNYVYSLAIHKKESSKEGINNIHCHIIFSERKLDGKEREEDSFFKRPDFGGLEKDRNLQSKKFLYHTRQLWEKIANEKLREKNIELINSKSLYEQKLEELRKKNHLKAEMLDREPVNISGKLYYKWKNKFRLSDDEKKAVDKFKLARIIKEIKEEHYKIKLEKYKNTKQETLNLEMFNLVMEKHIVIEKLEKDKAKIEYMQSNMKNITKNIMNRQAHAERIKEFEELKSQMNYNDRYMKLEEYFKNYNEFEILKKNNIQNKRYMELKEYFISIEIKDIYDENKLLKKQVFMNNKYNLAKEKIIRRLYELEEFSDEKLYDYYSNLSTKEKEKYYNTLQSELKVLNEKKSKIDVLVDKAKKEADIKNIRTSIYDMKTNGDYSKIIIEIERLNKDKLNNIEKIEQLEKLQQHIHSKNIDKEVSEILKEKRENLKTLRIEQDSINSSIKINKQKVFRWKKLQQFESINTPKLRNEKKSFEITNLKNKLKSILGGTSLRHRGSLKIKKDDDYEKE